ncbi:MAG: V-type proton ATPase subunit E [Methanobacteriaceae archaeon]|nr:V-type proton ATPase subunit E [Methanobacteriaceae archaeon]
MSVGTEKIIASIKEDAQKKSDDILSKASLECEKISEEGNKTAQAEKTKILEATEKQAGMKYQQIISEAKVNARRTELEAREELIEKSFRIASDKIEKQASEKSTEYVDSLRKMIKEASLEIGGGKLELLVREDDIGIAGKVVTDIAKDVTSELGVTTSYSIGEPINVIGGAILRTADGEIEVKNTIEARMLRFKKNLRSEVAKIIFK